MSSEQGLSPFAPKTRAVFIWCLVWLALICVAPLTGRVRQRIESMNAYVSARICLGAGNAIMALTGEPRLALIFYELQQGAVSGVMEKLEELQGEVRRLSPRIAVLERESTRLREAFEEARRAGKRQAAPFSCGRRNDNPERPGRRAESAYGSQARALSRNTSTRQKPSTALCSVPIARVQCAWKGSRLGARWLA